MLCPGDIAGLGGNDGSDVDVCAHSGFLRFTAADSDSPSSVWPSYNGCAHCTRPEGSGGTHSAMKDAHPRSLCWQSAWQALPVRAVAGAQPVARCCPRRRYLYVLDSGTNTIEALSLQSGSFAPAAAATLSPQPGGPVQNAPNLLAGAGRYLYAGAARVVTVWEAVSPVRAGPCTGRNLPDT
jgi:hypothetical protein